MQMKNIFIILMATFLFVSCLQNQKMKPIESSIKIEWTAYKTTDKVPVKGNFNWVELTNIGEGKAVEDFFNQAEFSLNAFDLSTGDIARDEKIQKSFFGLMNEAGKISGQFIFENNQWTIKLKMNGIWVNNIPAKIQFGDNLLNISASVDLKDFKALNVLEALNSVCFDLHKGADGISKVWDIVDVQASIKFEN